MANTIYVLNGPDASKRGAEQPEALYATPAELERRCTEAAARYGMTTRYLQTDSEDELVGLIHEAKAANAAGIVINPGDRNATSAAIHDALGGVNIPAVEVRMSNVYSQARLRHHSLAASAVATLCGFGIDGYHLAISGLAAKIGVAAKL